MKNVNYNLIKVLLGKLDDVWRVEKHYLNDVKGMKCNCSKILKKIWQDDEKHIAMLRKEIASHVVRKKFD